MKAPIEATTSISNTAVADPRQPHPERGGDASADQRLADDEQPADHQHRGVAEARDRFARRQDAGDRQGQQHAEANGVDPQTVAGKRNDGGCENGEHNPAVWVHPKSPQQA
jgi:hypothetical protein